jgi:tetratricopeptide (TPR) repeat protein
MIGRKIGSYRILEKIGGGGMGVVYKAHDEKLDRTVALKFLPHPVADSESRKQRFVREARAASALDHPNVCTIYDINETDDGQLYIAMSYCAGVPLDVRIAAGPLPIDSCIHIAAQTASGLSSAHAAGITHRDIKPANIIVTDDDAVKIVDFGLAKLSGVTALTREGATVGTVAYMSPEQARGGREVDHRTDIWSLGAVLYEMVTGHRAFAAEHDSAQLYLIVNEEPKPIRSLRPEAPEALALVIQRMLQKDPAARFASMEDVVAALERMRSSGGSGDHYVSGTLERARVAFDGQRWREAYEAFREADEDASLSPEDLEKWGSAAMWTSNVEDIVAARERAHAAYVKEGRTRDAARVAIELAHDASVNGRRSVCNGWLRRSESLLAGVPDAVESGYLARQKAQVAIEDDIDLEAALEYAATAREYAERFDDSDLLALALQDRGRALVLMDRVEDGMELLEEAMSLAMSGVLSPATVGSTYCNMISMCDRVADYRRAGEWSDSAVRWCAPHGESPFPGICAVRRADVMRVLGAWEDAEKEAERAIRASSGRHVLIAAEGFYLKGLIKTRRGEFDEAESCFQEAHQRGRHPVPGLALLRMAQGRAEAACSLIDRALEADSIALERIRLLPAGVDIALSVGDIGTARTRAEELQSLAGRYQSSVFHGQAAHALGAVGVAEGKPDAAVKALTEALQHWKAADMPYEEARTRLQLALAYWDLGDTDLASLEVSSARRVFQELGARPDVEHAESLTQSH